MPLHINDNGTAREVALHGLEGGATQDYNVYLNDNGTAVPVSTVDDAVLGNTLTVPNDNDVQTGITAHSGVRLNPNRDDMIGIRARISANSQGMTEAVLCSLDGMTNGTIYDTVDITGKEPGDTVDLYSDQLESGISALVLGGAPSGSYQRGRHTDSAQFPHEGTDMDCLQGIYSEGGSQSTTNRYNFYEFTSILG